MANPKPPNSDLVYSLYFSQVILKRPRYACSRYASCYSLLLVLGPSALGKGVNYL